MCYRCVEEENMAMKIYRIEEVNYIQSSTGLSREVDVE
jgi:hypothetical protein